MLLLINVRIFPKFYYMQSITDYLNSISGKAYPGETSDLITEILAINP